MLLSRESEHEHELSKSHETGHSYLTRGRRHTHNSLSSSGGRHGLHTNGVFVSRAYNSFQGGRAGRVKEETAASLDSVDLLLPTAPNGRRAVEVEAAPSEPLYAYLALSKTSAVC